MFYQPGGGWPGTLANARPVPAPVFHRPPPGLRGLTTPVRFQAANGPIHHGSSTMSWRLPADRSSIHSPPQPGIWPVSVISPVTVIDVRVGHKTNPDNRIVTVAFSPSDHRPISILERQVSADPRHLGALDFPVSLGPRNAIRCGHHNAFLHECDYGELATNIQVVPCGSLPAGRIHRHALSLTSRPALVALGSPKAEVPFPQVTHGLLPHAAR